MASASSLSTDSSNSAFIPLQQLEATTPQGQPTANVGNGVSRLSTYGWVETELALPNLSPQDVTYLNNVPVFVATSTSGSGGPVPPGDPVTNGGCTWSNLLGFTLFSYFSYLGFSGNGTHITNVSVPSDVVNITSWSLGLVSLVGESFVTSSPETGTSTTTAVDQGTFYDGLAGAGIDYLATIRITMHGDGSWSTSPSCT